MGNDMRKEWNDAMVVDIGSGVKVGSWADNPCYYVDAIDGKRMALLAGPFRTLEEAEKHKDSARKLAFDLDPKAPWYLYGCCRRQDGYKTGILNSRLGLSI